MNITAAVVDRKGGPFAVQQLEAGDLRSDELLVKIAATGICHTDIVVRDQWYPVPLPAVLGHEGAGVIERVGSSVVGLAPGDRPQPVGAGLTLSPTTIGRAVTTRRARPWRRVRR